MGPSADHASLNQSDRSDVLLSQPLIFALSNCPDDFWLLPSVSPFVMADVFAVSVPPFLHGVVAFLSSCEIAGGNTLTIAEIPLPRKKD